MPVSSQYTDYVIGQLQPAGTVSSRKMFGGVGLYIDEVFCALIGTSNRLFFRVGENNVQDYLDLGMEKFSGRKGSSGMPYYVVPEDVLEDPEELKTWAHKAREAAIAAKK